MRKSDTAITRCKKDVKPTPYDPMIAQNAAANTALAERSVAFSEDYFKNTVSPLIAQMRASAAKESDNQGKLFDLNYSQATKAAQRYDRYGVPAENTYYDMVRNFSSPEEEARQAQFALGDVRVGAANAQEQLLRRYGSLGIDPTSPAAIAAMKGASVNQGAAEASAMNRARNGARQLGMQLKSDAANFGRGGTSGILQFGAGAGSNSSSAFGIAQGAVNSGNAGAAVPMAGYGQGMQGYQANMNVYGGMAQSAIGAQAQMQSAGIGALGSLAGGAMGMMPFSDRRLKRDIVEVGCLPNGLKVYEFDYVWGGERQTGVMADEVIKVIPEAVVMHPSGYATVNYELLV